MHAALLIEFVVAPLLVGASTLAVRAWGPRAGGALSAFPAIVGPVLLITALNHGSAFAARTADATLCGLVSFGAFNLAYGRPALSWRVWHSRSPGPRCRRPRTRRMPPPSPLERACRRE